MSLQPRRDSTVDDVLYRGWRELRELGHHDPGFSLERNAMRELGLLDETGVDTEQQILTTIYENGYVTADLQVESRGE